MTDRTASNILKILISEYEYMRESGEFSEVWLDGYLSCIEHFKDHV